MNAGIPVEDLEWRISAGMSDAVDHRWKASRIQTFSDAGAMQMRWPAGDARPAGIHRRRLNLTASRPTPRGA